MLTLRHILCYSAEHSINHVESYINHVVSYIDNVVIYINHSVSYRMLCRVAKFSSPESQTLFRSVGGETQASRRMTSACIPSISSA